MAEYGEGEESTEELLLRTLGEVRSSAEEQRVDFKATKLKLQQHETENSTLKSSLARMEMESLMGPATGGGGDNAAEVLSLREELAAERTLVAELKNQQSDASSHSALSQAAGDELAVLRAQLDDQRALCSATEEERQRTDEALSNTTASLDAALQRMEGMAAANQSSTQQLRAAYEAQLEALEAQVQQAQAAAHNSEAALLEINSNSGGGGSPSASRRHPPSPQADRSDNAQRAAAADNAHQASTQRLREGHDAHVAELTAEHKAVVAEHEAAAAQAQAQLRQAQAAQQQAQQQAQQAQQALSQTQAATAGGSSAPHPHPHPHPHPAHAGEEEAHHSLLQGRIRQLQQTCAQHEQAAEEAGDELLGLRDALTRANHCDSVVEALKARVQDLVLEREGLDQQHADYNGALLRQMQEAKDETRALRGAAERREAADRERTHEMGSCHEDVMLLAVSIEKMRQSRDHEQQAREEAVADAAAAHDELGKGLAALQEHASEVRDCIRHSNCTIAR
jgi:hypothetical protein